MPRDAKKSGEEGHKGPGTLYVVSTPIGNLEDITLRGLKVLENVTIIAAESVSHTSVLLRHYGIKTKLLRYNQHNRAARGPQLVGELLSGLDVALVSDAGTPGISDPGVFLINLALKHHIKVAPVPGPSAVVAALSISGLPTESFAFQGFLSNKGGKRRKELAALASDERTLVFYEAPHRIRATLADIRETLGEREVVMVREMTKVFEEAKRGTAGEILESLGDAPVKGEITLVVAGNKEGKKDASVGRDIEERIESLLGQGELSIKDIASLISAEEHLPYRQVYKTCLAKKKLINDAPS